MTNAHPDQLLHEVSQVLDEIRAEADEIERQRQLTDRVVERLKETGIFRMAMPRAWGGMELTPLEQTRVLERLATADGSAAWCAMIGSDGGYIAAHLDDATAKEVFEDIDSPTVVVVAPSGLAKVIDGGYEISGRWGFASGSAHATNFVLGCRVFDQKGPRRRADGSPEMRLCIVPREKIEIVDTWYTTGLRGTGSNDLVLKDVVIPEARSCDLVSPPAVRSEPLYAYWPIWNANMAGVPLGLARRSIDLVMERARSKRVPTGSFLSDEVHIRQSIAHAEADLSSARSFYFDALGELWDAVKGDELSLQHRARWRLAMTHAFVTSVDVISRMYKTAGGSAAYTRTGLDRVMRDALTANQHINANLRSYELVGQMLFGDDPKAMFY